MTAPVPMPTNVRVVTTDGVEHPCEVVYRGRGEDGLHTWEVTQPFHPALLRTVLVDRMPPHSALVFHHTLP